MSALHGHLYLDAPTPAPKAVDPGPRFFVVSETQGLVGVAETQEQAEARAVYAVMATARTVYVHDRLTELLAPVVDPSDALRARDYDAWLAQPRCEAEHANLRTYLSYGCTRRGTHHAHQDVLGDEWPLEG